MISPFLNTIRTSDYIIVLIALFMFAFMPTSSAGIMFDTRSILIIWIFTFGYLIYLVVNNTIEAKSAIISFLIILYMTFATVISTDTYMQFSIARLGPVLTVMILFNIKFKRILPFKYMMFLLEFICWTIIIWNLLLLFQNLSMIDFTNNNYTQFYEYATSYSILQLKPVMTFGVHTFSSFFYFLIFSLCYFNIKKTKYSLKRFYIYMIFLFIYNILLFSSTSLIFSSIMIIMFVSLTKKLSSKSIIIAISFIAIFLFFQSELYFKYSSMIFSESNGFLPRYTEDSVFTENYKILSESILGIGFNIARNDNLSYTDSGYIVYLTMGNIIFMIGLYYLLFRFLSNNLNAYFIYPVFLTIMLFEFAIPIVLYIKFFYMIIFFVMYLKSLDFAFPNTQ